MNITDIAKLCGVSPSTVSKILHNKDENLTLETREKVLAVVKEYQYVPYSKVLSTAAPKTNLVGVLVNAYGPQTADLVGGAEEVLAENGYSILLCNTWGEQTKAEKYQHILETKNVDGIVCIGQERGIAEACGAPAVALWEHKVLTENERVADFYYERCDFSYLAVKHLLEQGHRKIGYVFCGDTGEAQGYCKAYKEYGIPLSEQYIFHSESIEELSRVDVPQCLNAEVTAVLCGNEEIASRVYEKLRERGENIPQAVSVLAVGAPAQTARLFSPPLSTVGLNQRALGGRLAEALLGMMEKRKKAHECGGRVAAELDLRGSVSAIEKSKHANKLVVVGSMNMDCSITVPCIPTANETLIASNTITLPGGKGANQAVGVGKLGGLVYMVGCLGDDAEGRQIYDSLAGNGVRMNGICFERATQTGKAYISIAADGESTIVVYPGANERLDRAHLKKNRQLLEGAKYCLLSLEITPDAAEYTIRECEKRGIAVIVKPSAASGLNEELYSKIEYFIPNEKEVRQFVPGGGTVEEMARALREKGVKNVIVTLGKNGCYLCNESCSRFFPAVDFSPVDTTGAADAFISALAVYLSEGCELAQAIGFATYAACISITRFGVQSAMVDRASLEVYREEILSKFKP